MILDLVCGKVVISAVQLLQLAEHFPQLFLIISFEQFFKKHCFQSASNMILDLVNGKVVISVVQLLQLAENCPLLFLII